MVPLHPINPPPTLLGEAVDELREMMLFEMTPLHHPRDAAEKPCFLATVLVESRGCAHNLRGLRDIS